MKTEKNQLDDSMIERRTPKFLRLKKETMNSLMYSTEAMVLQPLKSPRTILAEKSTFDEEVISYKKCLIISKDLKQLKTLIKSYTDKMSSSLTKINKMFNNSIETNDVNYQNLSLFLRA